MANGSPYTPRQVEDFVTAFPDGVNMGVSPLLIPKTQLASGTNVTVRGTLVQPRPPFRKIRIDFGYPGQSQMDFENGKFQGGCYYKPDNGFESLMFQINGRLFQITPGATSASFVERTIPGDPNPISPNQAWLWQAEKWIICMDGVSKPIFFDQTGSPTTRRSTWNTNIPFSTTVTVGAVVPALGGSVNITVASDTDIDVNDSIWVLGYGNYLVSAKGGAGVITIVNLTGTPGKAIPVGRTVSWFHTSTELPPGRMGAYGLGQNWYSLLDGRQFIASDQVGSSSGTQANNYRDAVLNVVQNTYLAGGGTFFVPGTSGDIKAFTFVPTLDASLGQGPLQVLTPNTIFSCNVPTDRTTWQDLTNPILSESLITNGGLGQWSTTVANSDTIMRSVDGIRSLILARRDFNTWGNTPISREVDPILSKDSPSLLQFTSSIVFDNRLLMTADPVLTDRGTYWKQIVALNMDPVSSLRGKAASVYDGSWIGLNVFQLITGQFSGTQRAFALCYNVISAKIELYELLKQDQAYFDNDVTRITSAFQTSVLLKDSQGKTPFDLCRLIDGEIYLDNIRGTTDVQVWYRPDSNPCWTQWTKFSICAPVADDDPKSKPGYRMRVGLGMPSSNPCEPGNNRPLCYGNYYQLRFVMTGPYRFLGGRIRGEIVPQSQYAPVAGCCENDSVIPIPSGTNPETIIVIGDVGDVIIEDSGGNLLGG